MAAVGPEQAKALHLAAEEAIDVIGRVCEAEKIDADLQPNGLLTISNSPLQDEILRGEVETAERFCDWLESVGADRPRIRTRGETK